MTLSRNGSSGGLIGAIFFCLGVILVAIGISATWAYIETFVTGTSTPIDDIIAIIVHFIFAQIPIIEIPFAGGLGTIIITLGGISLKR